MISFTTAYKIGLFTSDLFCKPSCSLLQAGLYELSHHRAACSADIHNQANGRQKQHLAGQSLCVEDLHVRAYTAACLARL